MRCRLLTISIFSVLLLALALASAASAASASSVRIVRPLGRHAVSGPVTVLVRTTARPRSVRFYVDGVRRWTERYAPYRFGGNDGFLNASVMAPGAHRLTVRAVFRHGVVTASKVLRVRRSGRRQRSRGLVLLRLPRHGAPVRHRVPARHAPARRPARPAQVRPEPRPQPAPAAPATAASSPLAGAAAVAQGPGSALFRTDFSSSAFSEWTDVQRVATDRIQSVAAPGLPGATAARFEVRDGDHVNGEQNSRAELAWEDHPFSEGEQTTFSWSTMLAPDFPAPSDWADIFQWKNEGSGSPPLQVGVDHDTINLSAGSQANWQTLWSTPIVRGQWVSFVAHIKWSSDPSVGWVDFWFNGAHVLDHAPLATLYSGKRNYLKIGYYRSENIAQTGVVYDTNLLVTRDS